MFAKLDFSTGLQYVQEAQTVEATNKWPAEIKTNQGLICYSSSQHCNNKYGYNGAIGIK